MIKSEQPTRRVATLAGLPTSRIVGRASFADAREAQSSTLARVIRTLAAQLDTPAAASAFAGDRPIFVAIGASHAAAAAGVWSLRERGIDAWRISAGDLAVHTGAGPDRVIAISQSGRSTETLAALTAVSDSARIIITNVAGSPMAELPGTHLRLGDVADSYASTIGYTATLAALGMLTDVWNGGALDAGWAGIHREFSRVDKLARRTVATLGDHLIRARFADFVAAPASAGSAEAGALLLREVARIPADGMTTRRYLHGAMESAGGGIHILLGRDRECALAATLAAAGSPVLLVTDLDGGGDGDGDGPAGVHVIRIPRLPATQRAVLEAAVLQSLAEQAAWVRALDIEDFVFHNDDTKVPAS